MNPAALYRETSGSGEPIWLLHGWGMNLRVFDALRAALAQRYAVTALDLPGHGRSDFRPGLSPRGQLELIGAGLPPGATLLGWSLGGQFALQLAAEPSLAVRRLVLIASTPRFVRGEDWDFGLSAATLQQFGEQLRYDGAQTIADFLALQVRGSAEAASVLDTLRHALREHGDARPEALAAGLAILKHNDLRALAARVAVPTLLIAGQYDRVTPPQAAQALAQMLPSARLLMLPRAGHAPFLSHADQVRSALHAFLEPPAAGHAAAAAGRP